MVWVMKKVFFLDIDGVLTVPGTYNIDSRAITEVKKWVKRGALVAFVTGNDGAMLERQLVPLLRANELLGKVSMYGEMGSYRYEAGGDYLLNDQFINYIKRDREQLLNEIERIALGKGIPITLWKSFNDMATRQIVIRYKIKPTKDSPDPPNCSIEKMKRIVQTAIANLKDRQKLKTPLTIVTTRTGLEIMPEQIGKKFAVEKAKQHFGLQKKKYRGFAFGDSYFDKPMGGGRIKFIQINKEVEDFLRHSRFIFWKVRKRELKSWMVATRRRYRQWRTARKERKKTTKIQNTRKGI